MNPRNTFAKSSEIESPYLSKVFVAAAPSERCDRLGRALDVDFSHASTPADEVNGCRFSSSDQGLIFVMISGLLAYAIIRFRARKGDMTEPAQVFGSMQIELSWTIIPILIIVVLFLTTARVLFSVQDAQKPANGAGRDGGGAPVLVGVPLSAIQRSDGE